METTPEKFLIKITQIIEKIKIKYFVTGGFAVSVWGRPRATFDIDIVIKLMESEINQLEKALRKISEAGYFDEESVREAIRKKGEFNFIDPETNIKVDFWVSGNDQMSLMEMKRRKLKIINRNKVYFVSPEDLILNKLKWHKESESDRQLEDVQSILAVSGVRLDEKYLKNWAKRLGVLTTLKKIWRSSSTSLRSPSTALRE